MWVDLCYSERGRGHIANGIPCQDKTFAIKRNDTDVVALSDGAGSARLSHYGAEKVTESISFYLADNFEKIFGNDDAAAVKEDVIGTINKDIMSLAADLSCKESELACTMLAVAVRDNRFLLMHCGDGVIGFMRDNDMKVATKPTNGEFVNETVFITSKAAKMNLRIAKGMLNDIRAFVLMSDGSEACLYSKREQYFAKAIPKIIDRATFMPICFVQETIANAFHNTVIKKTTDDCSVAFLIKRDGTTSRYGQLTREEKYELFKIDSDSKKADYMLKKTESFLRMIQHPGTIKEIATESGIRSRWYLKSKLKKYEQKGLLTVNGDKFLSTIILNNDKS